MVAALAKKSDEGTKGRQIFVCLEADMAKALGQCLCLAGGKRRYLCIDRVRLQSGSFLDIGRPVGPALPVVVKTLVLENGI
jgi:ethanolamine utilization protein EutA